MAEGDRPPGPFESANRNLRHHLIPLSDIGRINLQKLYELREQYQEGDSGIGDVVDRSLYIPDAAVKTHGKRLERDLGQLRREMWREQNPGEQDPQEPHSGE
ncbi:MAG TPA: hypothetical protein VEW42_05375 [Candidatus Eisenbacteria bacterium]|nr:hypothetical protein [Candidatus Eisenbacteria bacterium]